MYTFQGNSQSSTVFHSKRQQLILWSATPDKQSQASQNSTPLHSITFNHINLDIFFETTMPTSPVFLHTSTMSHVLHSDIPAKTVGSELIFCSSSWYMVVSLMVSPRLLLKNNNNTMPPSNWHRTREGTIGLDTGTRMDEGNLLSCKLIHVNIN